MRKYRSQALKREVATTTNSIHFTDKGGRDDGDQSDKNLVWKPQNHAYTAHTITGDVAEWNRYGL